MTAMEREKEDQERAVAALKSRKASMNVDAYYDELEGLMVRLARLVVRQDTSQ